MRHRGEEPGFPYYGQNLKVKITRHRPPSPFGCDYKTEYHRRDLEDDELWDLSLSDHVIKYPVVETAPLDDDSTAELIMEKPVRVGYWRCAAQVIVCTVVPQCGQPYRAVAKIFDPLYRQSVSDSGRHPPFDITRDADEDYSLEASAYETLDRAGLTGNLVPMYHGSWTFTLDIPCNGSQYQRSIRLILIEYLDGCTIADLITMDGVDGVPFPGSDALDEKYRLDVMVQIVDAETRLVHNGVIHRDLAPRNVVLVPDPRTTTMNWERLSPPSRVVIIDFACAEICSLTKYTRSKRVPTTYVHPARHRHTSADTYANQPSNQAIDPSSTSSLTELPCNPVDPMLRGWGPSIDDFSFWLPVALRDSGDPMNRKARPCYQWLVKEFGKDSGRAHLYKPMRELP
ncbi:hypothetical protein F5Y18DRAFT_120587 [Xylariaceae sp. FL1019]|nr:hypothetical protein F5Y18DRAFT_120587 [Xylariaceae sp. FL1019]